MEEIKIFKDYYENVKEKLNKKLINFNKDIIDEENYLIKENLKLFSNLNSDGKLIRGTLVNLGYNLIKENNLDYSYDLALAFEVFQTSILIHDDIIDNATLRRGIKTINYNNYTKYYNITNKEEESKKISESLGICMGDIGLYYSNLIISKSYHNDSNLGNILTYFNEIVLKTIKGEILDVILPFLEKNNIENGNLNDNIMTIYELKTAYYTIIGPLCLGMILAGTNDEQIKDIKEFGYNVGVAFQMQDDLLGIYSDDLVLGKNVGSDIEEFKQTILYSYVKENKEYYDELIKIYGTKVSDINIRKIRKIFEDSKAKEYTLKEIEKLYDKGINIIEKINWINEDKKKLLKGFVMFLKSRNK